MPSPEDATVKGLLQVLEHTLGALNAASAAATQLITAQRTGKPLAPSVLTHYEEQFATLTKQRERMARAYRPMVDDGRGRSALRGSKCQHRAEPAT